jgi:hypothetical protein
MEVFYGTLQDEQLHRQLMIQVFKMHAFAKFEGACNLVLCITVLQHAIFVFLHLFFFFHPNDVFF